jgi:hypothetical protein
MFDIIRPEGAAHLNRPHVIVHRMKLYDDEVATVDGIPVTTPERMWLDLHHEPDLSYKEYRIGIEYEGEHHGDELQIERDIARSERYVVLSWTEVRISKRHMLNDGKAAVAKVRSALVRAGWRPGR